MISVIAGDHADLDPGFVCSRDRGLGGRPRRIDDAHEREQREPVHQIQQVGAGVEVGAGEVLARGRHHAQALGSEPLVLRHVARLEVLVGRGRGELRVEMRRGARQELVRRALDETANDLLPGLVDHAVEGGHQLVGGVEGKLGHARVALACCGDVQATLRGEHDEGAFRRVADHLAVSA